jgi:hypothetical protein
VGFVIFPLELTGVPEVPVIPLKWREFDAEQFPIVYTDEECPTCISNPCMCLVLEGWHPTDKRKLNDDERARLEMRLMDANNKAQERSAKR